MPNLTLQESIANAMQEQTNAEGTTSQTDAKSTETTSSTESNKETSKSDASTESHAEGTTTETNEDVVEVEGSPEEIREALELRKVLMNPATQLDYVKNLAKQIGLIKEETGATTTQAVKTAVEVLKAHLGEENEFLAEKLAPAIEELLNERVNKPLAQNKLEAKTAEVQREVDSVYAEFEKLPNFKTLEPQMIELMAEISPGPRSTMQTYVKRLYDIASGHTTAKEVEKKATEKTQKTITKIVQNAKETKINKVSSDVDETRVEKGSHRPSAREAVLQALKELQK